MAVTVENHHPDTNAELTHRDLLQDIDCHVQGLVEEEWKGSIPLTLFNSQGISGTYDMCDRIGHKKYDVANCYDVAGRLYFNPVEYPPPVAGIKTIPKKDPTYESLKLSLTRIAHDAGSPMVPP